jgi:hypothetical protein
LIWPNQGLCGSADIDRYDRARLRLGVWRTYHLSKSPLISSDTALAAEFAQDRRLLLMRSPSYHGAGGNGATIGALFESPNNLWQILVACTGRT